MKYREIKGELIGEVIYNKKLNNGLEVFYMPKSGYSKKYAIFATHFGSNDIKFKGSKNDEVIIVPEGIAHFLEHKMFEEPEGNVFDRFADLGASANAYTNFNLTTYYFTTTESFYENLKNLIQFVQSPYFTEESVKKEKGIIEQEIRMYEDNPQWRVFFNLLKGMYHEHPVKNDIAGTVESIHQTTKENLYDCYETFYHPSNMVLFVIGDLDREQVFEKAEAVFRDQPEKESITIEKLYPQEITTIKEALMETKLSISTPIFNIGYKDIDLGLEGIALIKKEIATRIALDIVFGKGSSLYEELYDKGLINSDTFGADYIGDVDYGHSIIGGESESPQEVLQTVNRYVLDLKKNGLNPKDFDRIHRKQIGEHLSLFNSIEFIGSSFVSYHFKGVNLLNYVEELQNMTFETVEMRFVKHFDENHQVMSIVTS
ncbi:peptidase M16 domain protein [Alkaliphilus metalliredigens QYMF]|uniref:Peptidase M16 domain protein n=1 Tax=Alkaliphilus metalliredigens (strain QYMF) TaxID=293826 RepID=A6TS73_ALKMQ|nr:pitrilysin family protein [Alkaliphilus metalliredigens]ABR49041.1 peptidase M16 domain protein [Alkaliphilus metalliredigens QYMF]